MEAAERAQVERLHIFVVNGSLDFLYVIRELVQVSRLETFNAT